MKKILALFCLFVVFSFLIFVTILSTLPFGKLFLEWFFNFKFWDKFFDAVGDLYQYAETGKK
jgi:hypothetical protein